MCDVAVGVAVGVAVIVVVAAMVAAGVGSVAVHTKAAVQLLINSSARQFAIMFLHKMSLILLPVKEKEQEQEQERQQHQQQQQQQCIDKNAQYTNNTVCA